MSHSVRSWITAFAACSAGVTALGQPGQLGGKVVDESGKAVFSARIAYRRLPAAVRDQKGKLKEAPGEAHVSAGSVSDANGAYDVGQTPAGDYVLCVTAAGYLSTCEWNGWHRVSVGPGENVRFGAITLVRAAAVTVHISFEPIR